MAGLALALACAALPGRAACAERSQEREYAIKAAFLYNFAGYVTWPPGAPNGADEPFLIGVLGADPFGAILDELAASKSLDGRKIAVRRFRSPSDVTPCHILFIGPAGAEQLSAALQKAAAAHALLVADKSNLTPKGIHISFVENNKVRFEVDPEAAQRAGLKISSKLLRLARVVEQPAGGR